MAKAAKDETERSVLRLAFDAYQRGDAVQARALANEVLAGKKAANDDKVAAELAKKLSSPEAPVAETVDAVARELALRTQVPPKAYLLLLTVVAAYVLLVVLAVARY